MTGRGGDGEDSLRAPGLARAVDDLFRKAEPANEPEPAARVPAADPVSTTPPAAPRVDLPPAPGDGLPVGVSTEDLRRALAAFMAATPDARTALAVRVRFQAEMLEAAGEQEGIAVAVEKMLLARPDDTGARELACQLVSDEVARVLTWRLVDGCVDEERGRQLALAFGRLNPEMADAVAGVLANTDDRVVRRVLTEVLVRLAPEAQEIMAGFLQDGRWQVVRDAVTVIGRTAIPNALQFLMTALAHDDDRVRSEALVALGTVGGTGAPILARSYLDVSSTEVRGAAAEAVGLLKDDGSVPLLLDRVESEADSAVLLLVLRALGRIGNEAALPALQKRAAGSRFGRGSSDVRVAAVKALAALDREEGWEVITALVDDRDEEVRGVAKFLLRSR
jgi:HEAT repeat protein